MLSNKIISLFLICSLITVPLNYNKVFAQDSVSTQKDITDVNTDPIEVKKTSQQNLLKILDELNKKNKKNCNNEISIKEALTFIGTSIGAFWLVKKIVIPVITAVSTGIDLALAVMENY